MRSDFSTTFADLVVLVLGGRKILVPVSRRLRHHDEEGALRVGASGGCRGNHSLQLPVPQRIVQYTVVLSMAGPGKGTTGKTGKVIKWKNDRKIPNYSRQ